MIKGMFIVGDNKYACSNNVDMEFKSEFGVTWTTITMNNSFSSTDMPEELSIVDCVIKYDGTAPINFKACIKSISMTNGIILSPDSPFERAGVERILGRITCLL